MLDNNIHIKTNNQINDHNLIRPKIKTEQTLPINVVDPTRVTKAAKEEEKGHNLFSYNPDSVYEKFIKSLESSPILAEGARKFLLNRQFINNNIKSDKVLLPLFENFMKSIEMDEEQIQEFLKFQQGSYTKFHGEFFDYLRTLIKDYPNNEDLKNIIRNFLRSYDCFASIPETNKSIHTVLDNINKYLPEMLKEPFYEMMDKLISNSGKDINISLSILKNEILPFIGKYVSKMNDFGPIRDYVSLLIHNMVRLETGSLNNFSNDLDNLIDYIKFNFDVDDKYIEELKASLINNYHVSPKAEAKPVQAFLKLLEIGVKESDNLVNKGLMEEMTEALLFNQNVHLPLMHLFLPLNYKGLYMFSELWIGKEAEEITHNKKGQKYNEYYKAFVTFDIQNVGYFETILIFKDAKLSLDIYIPSSLSNNMEKIKNDLNNILSIKKLAISNLRIQENMKKRKITEVFTNISERINGVDVTI